MRILVLSKRQSIGKDLLDDRFGRLRELPLALAARGHKVLGVCLSYRLRPEGVVLDGTNQGTVTWHSLNLGTWSLPSLPHRYLRLADDVAAHLQPDLVWACSDAFHTILGRWISRRLGAAYAVDLKDNFESYPATRIPGVTRTFIRAIRSAHGISCVSGHLAQRVRESYRYEGPIEVIPNGVRRDLFFPRDRYACRRDLGLPNQVQIIGTAGALGASRGTALLFQAFERLAGTNPDLHLVICGPKEPGFRIPANPRIRYFGVLPAESVPSFLGALDVAVVCNRDSSFGRYCYPQKLHEIIASQIPIVAAATGAAKEALAGNPAFLYDPHSVESLTDACQRQLNDPTAVPIDAPDWDTLGERLEALLAAAVRRRATKRNNHP